MSDELILVPKKDWEYASQCRITIDKIKKYVRETLADIPDQCCYTHDDQREPLEGIKKILEEKK